MDPIETLGLSDDVDDVGVKRAYLEAIRKFPPDRAPERFQEIQQAYELVKDARARAQLRLFGLPPFQSFAALAPREESGPPVVSLEHWAALLRERKG